MKLHLCFGACLTAAVCIAGCASPRLSGPPAAVVTPLHTRVIPAARADAITIGKSTRSDVSAALGATQAVRFESGFEVWIYRTASDPPARAGLPRGNASGGREEAAGSAMGELVVLFAPSGVVAKARMRPPSYGDPQPGP